MKYRMSRFIPMRMHGTYTRPTGLAFDAEDEARLLSRPPAGLTTERTVWWQFRDRVFRQRIIL